MPNLEWSPQQWLQQPGLDLREFESLCNLALRDIFEAVTLMPDLADSAILEFGMPNGASEPLPYGNQGSLSDYFDIENGWSVGEKNYIAGNTAYISSGDRANSIISLVEPVPDETFEQGGITVTAFGKASLQPWPFMARGNGGSSVRVLLPKYDMGLREMLWFVGQVNRQRWRFFYARMAIKGRIAALHVTAPPEPLPDRGDSIYQRIIAFREQLKMHVAL